MGLHRVELAAEFGKPEIPTLDPGEIAEVMPAYTVDEIAAGDLGHCRPLSRVGRDGDGERERWRCRGRRPRTPAPVAAAPPDSRESPATTGPGRPESPGVSRN